jgi:uncharacterized protein (TIGR00369 family)
VSDVTPNYAELLETFTGMTSGTLDERMGIEITHGEPDLVTGRMPVAGNVQILGLLHGGASGVLAESLGSIGSALYAAPDRIALGIELSCSHHRAAKEGFVYGEATPLARSRSLATYQIVITDEESNRICTARLTCMLKPHLKS